VAEYETLKLDVSDHIATITLDRPPVNAVTVGVWRDLAAVFAEIADRTSEIRVAILTGAGRCFCGGRDLKLSPLDPPEQRSVLARRGYAAVYHSAVPLIAAVNGPAMGAGCCLALLCDFVIASDRAVFAMPEIDAGLNFSAAMLLRGMNQYQARYLGFTGDRIDLIKEVRITAAKLAAKSPEALRGAKWSANEVEILFADFERAYRAIESRVSIGLMKNDDTKEATRAFAEKRQPVFKTE
jgi:enoyl-CoA hydratase